MIYLEKYSDFISGILIAIGGSESKGSEIDINNSILSEVIRNSKYGIDSNIIIIPTASSFQNQIESEYRTTFEKIGCKNIKTLFISSKDQVDSNYNLDLLKNSNVIMFSGGDQSRISQCFLGTKFLSNLKNKVKWRAMVIRPMIISNSSSKISLFVVSSSL